MCERGKLFQAGGDKGQLSGLLACQSSGILFFDRAGRFHRLGLERWTIAEARQVGARGPILTSLSNRVFAQVVNGHGQIDEIGQAEPTFSDLLPPPSDTLDEHRDVAKPRQHSLLSRLDALGQRDLIFPREQLGAAHLTQVHINKVTRERGVCFRLVPGTGVGMLPFGFAESISCAMGATNASSQLGDSNPSNWRSWSDPRTGAPV